MENLLDDYSVSELKTTEIKYLDLKRQEWGFSRGAKTTRDYLYDDDSVAIKITYAYTYSDGERDIATVSRHIDFFDKDANAILSQDITKPMNITQLGDLNEEIRRGRVHYMKTAANDLPQYSPYVPEPWKTDFLNGPDATEILGNYYREEMKLYTDENSSKFEDAINNESNHFMMQVLNLNVRPPDALFPTGLTIKQSILHQLTGVY